jgi:hypothetical protein
MALYAEWLMETMREKRGLKFDDKSQDEEIIKYLQSGEKLSKSKHMENWNNKEDKSNE